MPTVLAICLLSSPGNFVGPLVFRKEDAPDYAPGFIVVVITSLAAGILGLVYRFVCMWHNKKRDQAGIMEGFDHAYEDDLTDMKVTQNQRLILLMAKFEANRRLESAVQVYSLAVWMVRPRLGVCLRRF